MHMQLRHHIAQRADIQLVRLEHMLQHALRLIPPLPNAHLRNALKAIHRPGAPAPIVIMSLGLGLALLLVIALVDGSLRHQLDRESIPDAPSFIFMDLFDDVQRNRIKGILVVHYYAFASPNIVHLMAPVAVLVAVRRTRSPKRLSP